MKVEKSNMNKRKLHGWWVLIVAVLACITIAGRSAADIFCVNYGSDYFYKRYLSDYTYDATDPPVYAGESTGTVKVYTLQGGAISLKPGTYDVGFLYYGADDTTVLKIFASDYTSPDNSGGKMLLSKQLSAEENYLHEVIELDQNVSSVYVLAETKAANFSVGYLLLESWAPVCTDTVFYCVATILCAIALFVLLNRPVQGIVPGKTGEKDIAPERLVLLCVFVSAAAVFVASLPLLQSKLSYGHDVAFHLARIEGLASGLASGQFPVRVHGETLNGFGYPNSYFYPELLMYFPAALYLLGVNTVTCYKAYVILLHVLTVILAYLPFKKLFHSRFLGLALAVIYLLNPYRLICAYYRAAIGELAAMTFIPLVLYGLYAVLIGDQNDWPYLVFGATGVLQSHILTTELTALFCAVLVLVFIRQLFTPAKRILTLICAGAYTVMLNVWFILPMLAMSIAIRPAVYTRTQSPANYAQYNIGYLFSTTTLTGIGPHLVGWVALFATALYLLYRIALASKGESKNSVRFADVLAVAAIVCAVATTAYFPWDRIAAIPLLGKLLDTIQFPYRLLTIVAVCTTAIAGYAICLWLKKKAHRMTACVVMCCLAVFTACLLHESAFLNAAGYENKSYYASNLGNSQSVGQYEYLASGADIDDIVNTAPRIQSDNPSLEVSGWERNGTCMEFSYSLDPSLSEENQIVLPLTYIPKYKVTVNGQPVSVTKTELSRVAFTAPAAAGTVTVRYEEPLLFRAFEIASVLTLALLLLRKKLWAWILQRCGKNVRMACS